MSTNTDTNTLPEYAIWFKEALDAVGTTPSELARKTGENNMKYYNIINGKTRPSYDTIQQTLKAYPRINANFLLSGQKPVLLTSSATIVGSTFETVSVPLRLTGVDTETVEYTKVLTKDRELEGCFVLKQIDDSMLPRFPKGTELLARPILQQDWPYVNSKLCAVLFRNTFMVRLIKENDLKKHGYLTLYATAPDAGYIQIDADDLRGLYEIIEIVGGGVV